MAVDQAMAEAVQRGDVPPTLRFYSWRPRALSLGYHQPLHLVDRSLARQYGIDVVRRITGGAALLHSDELTYAIAVPRRHRLVRGGVRASYAALTQGLAAGLEALGLAPAVGAPAHAAEETLPGLCFWSPSGHELWVAEHKMVASAQGRVHGGVLQHGSLVMSHDLDLHPLTPHVGAQHSPAGSARRVVPAHDDWRTGADPHAGRCRAAAHGAPAGAHFRPASAIAATSWSRYGTRTMPGSPRC